MKKGVLKKDSFQVSNMLGIDHEYYSLHSACSLDEVREASLPGAA